VVIIGSYELQLNPVISRKQKYWYLFRKNKNTKNYYSTTSW